MVEKVPESTLERGSKSSAYFYTKWFFFGRFIQIERHSARCASGCESTPEFWTGGSIVGAHGGDAAGQRGNVGGRPPGASGDGAALRGDVGELEGMKGSGDLEGAYAAGKRVEGGAGEVLGAWLEEVETQLAFEKVLRELELHIRREEMWIVCWLS